MNNKFILKIKGDDFVLTMQGEGDSSSAKEAVEKAFPGQQVKIVNVGSPDRADINGN